MLAWKIKDEVWANESFSNETQRKAASEIRKDESTELYCDRALVEGLHASYQNAQHKALFHEGMKMCYLAEVCEKLPDNILPYEGSRASWDNIS